ncbi:MAG: sigma 54-interacting transcriptional regulator [Gemmataceae bacterium]|nr:sigma 54-interacting transcriptional regulator [Gemmataceae bacterium]
MLIIAGALVCLNALAVLVHVQLVPDLGLRSAFSPMLKAAPRDNSFHPEPQGDPRPRAGDRVVKLGDLTIETWPDLLRAPRQLQARLASLSGGTPPDWAKWDEHEEVFHVKAEFLRPLEGVGPPLVLSGWCELGGLPVEEMVPTVLWFFLKFTLFMVGALVLWNRPNDDAAALFFLLCIVTLGAYMGGYHWPYIASQPLLTLVFMVCAVLLPVVSLHFYLTFPRRKRFFERHPRWTLAGVYALPLTFLGVLAGLYFHARSVARPEVSAAEVQDALDLLRGAIYLYLGVAMLWYLGSIAALVHSYRITAEPTERNQVKWILFGGLLALVPFGYSLYLALYEPDAFGAGAATWPMFAASVCLTVAFAVSITRYRLMELDQVISSGMVYFLISFLAGLAYYAVVFLGTLLFQHAIAGPSLSHALTVSTTALVLMLVLDLARSRVMRALDRRFHRQKYQLDITLQRMGQAVQQLVDPPTLVNRLLHSSADLLGVSRGAVYLREDDPERYRLAGALGEPTPPAELDPAGLLLEALRARGTVTIPPWPGLPLDEAQQRLAVLGGALAHGLAHDGRILAVLVLGPKDRGPYQPEDLNLLAAFAQITVPALESAQGHQTIEVLNRDLRAKVEKIAEQQRRILALQSELRKASLTRAVLPAPEPVNGEANGAAETNGAGAPPVKAPSGSGVGGGIVGSGPQLRQLLHLVRKVAANDRTVVLIRGESGTGKELLAQAVHQNSPRAGKPFVKVHCAALAPTLLESELFGHVKGAFTGAHKDKAGRFELANGGTLFLDEIGDISLEVQTKLLRVLQEMTFERVGSNEPVKVDVRILAATHQDLEGLIRAGRFRMDLFYRLNVFPIVVPPLRERREDLIELVQHFLRLAAQRLGKPVPQIDDDALLVLRDYGWPGNVRQLENVIERAVVIAEGPLVTLQELPEEILEETAVGHWPEASEVLTGARRGVRQEREERSRREREQILKALATAGGNKAEAARALGLARSTLVSRLKKLGLD